MPKIVQITTGMYTYIDEEKDFDEQKYDIIGLTDNGIVLIYKDGKWEELNQPVLKIEAKKGSK
jgi:hypothetical protein